MVRLIEEALESSPSVKEARARIEEAEALKAKGEAGLLPKVRLGASFTRKGGNLSEETTEYSAEGSVSLGLDPFGRTRKHLEGLSHEVREAEEDLLKAQADLSAEVASTYLELCALEREILLLKERLNSCERQYRDLVLARFGAGLSDYREILEAEREMASLRRQIKQRERGVEIRKAALGALLGKPPGTLEDLGVPDRVPLPPLEVVLATPARVIEARPDVRKAKEAFLAQAAYLEEARRDRFPVIQILGSIALSALTFGDLLHYPLVTFRGGPSLDLELFTGGEKAAQIRLQEARVKQAMAQYEEAVLQALKEVQEALVSLQTTWEEIREIEGALDEAKELLRVQEARFAAGLCDYEEVIRQRQSSYELEIALVELQVQLAKGFVALYKALGG